MLDRLALQNAQVLTNLCPLAPGPSRCRRCRADSLLRLPRRRNLPAMMVAPNMVMTTMGSTLKYEEESNPPNEDGDEDWGL